MLDGEKLQGTILFADVMGCSEISNNCPIEEYARILDEYHNCGHATYRKLGLDRYSHKVREFNTRGDEVCLILHSKMLEDTEEKATLNDARNALIFAISIKLLWRSSSYNLDRIKNGLLPRDIGIGIHQGPIYFYKSSIKEEESSEGFAINLAKRIEGESRNGKYTKIMVSGNCKYWMEKNKLPLEFEEYCPSELKGITTIPDLYEIKDFGKDLKASIAKLIKDIDFKAEEIEKYKELAKAYPSDFWINLLVECVEVAKRDATKCAETTGEEEVSIGKIAQLEEIGEIRKGTISYYLEEARKNFFVGRYLGTIYNLNKALELSPEDPKIYSNRGVTYEYLRKYKEAYADFTKAIEFDPNFVLAYDGRAYTLSKLKKYKEALADLTKIIELDPQYVEAYFNRGVILRKLNKYEKALADFDKVIELDSNYVEAYCIRSRICIQLKKYEEALPDLDKLLELDPNHSSAYYNRACIYSLKKEKDKLTENLKKAIDINPKFKNIARKDEDFKFYLNKKWFKELIK